MSAVNLREEGFPLVMRSADLCRALNISKATLYRRVKSGQGIPAYARAGTGKGIRLEWNRADVEAWLSNSRRYLRRAS